MSLALVTTFFSHAPKAERFNNVIDDFDTYLQLEKEGKVQEQKQQLPVNTQNQGYDIFSSLSTVPAPNEKQKSAAANKGTKGKNSGKKKSAAASNKKNDVAKTEAENSDTTTFPEVCAVTTENVVAPIFSRVINGIRPISRKTLRNINLSSIHWVCIHLNIRNQRVLMLQLTLSN